MVIGNLTGFIGVVFTGVLGILGFISLMVNIKVNKRRDEAHTTNLETAGVAHITNLIYGKVRGVEDENEVERKIQTEVKKYRDILGKVKGIWDECK